MSYTIQIRRSAEAADLLRDHIADRDTEELWGIFLSRRNELVAYEMLSKGTFNSTPIDARTILKRALMKNAAAIILCHNHPSGRPAPSLHDIEQTKHVKKACGVFDIELLDHLILTKHSYFSFADEVTSKYQSTNN